MAMSRKYVVGKTTVDWLVNDEAGKQGRVAARQTYHRLKNYHQSPKEKKELWRQLGKHLSLNDFQFERKANNKAAQIKSISSLSIQGEEAQGLSVDCLRSFCAKLGIGRSGRLKKDDLLN